MVQDREELRTSALGGATGLSLRDKAALNKAQGAGGACSQGKEFGFYLRCNKKPKGSEQGGDTIRLIFKNYNLSQTQIGGDKSEVREACKHRRRQLPGRATQQGLPETDAGRGRAGQSQGL